MMDVTKETMNQHF